MTSIRDALEDIKLLKGVLAKKNMTFIISFEIMKQNWNTHEHQKTKKSDFVVLTPIAANHHDNGRLKRVRNVMRINLG